jgi:hypothetical protein
MSGSPRQALGAGSGAARTHRATTRSSGPSDASVADMLNELLRRMYLSAPSDVGAVIAEQARRIGARDAVLYLIDYEQRALMRLSAVPRADLAPLSVVGTIAGRAFTTTSILRSAARAAGGRVNLWAGEEQPLPRGRHLDPGGRII